MMTIHYNWAKTVCTSLCNFIIGNTVIMGNWAPVSFTNSSIIRPFITLPLPTINRYQPLNRVLHLKPFVTTYEETFQHPFLQARFISLPFQWELTIMGQEIKRDNNTVVDDLIFTTMSNYSLLMALWENDKTEIFICLFSQQLYHSTVLFFWCSHSYWFKIGVKI